MPRGAANGFSIDVDTRALSQLARDLKGIDNELRKDLMRRMRKALDPAKNAVKQEASWSSRIPGAVSGRVGYRRNGVVARIVVNAAKAPEAAPINNNDREGTFRHPVWGNRSNWVSQQARPFMKRGAERAQPDVIREVSEVFTDVARHLKFRGV